MKQEKKIVIWVDNSLTIELAKTMINHKKSKHIDFQFHFIIEKIMQRSMELEYVGSREQILGMFTKPFPIVLFHEYRKLICMKEEKI